MNKIYGAAGRQDGLYRIGENKWELIYGFGKDSEEDASGWNYRQRFTQRPTKDEVLSIIKAQINAETDEKILHGFKWDGKPVKIDNETQSNITGIMANLPYLPETAFPLRFKLGEYPDGAPSFHEFASAEEFSKFSMAGVAFKSQCYNEGWTAIQELKEINFDEIDLTTTEN